MLRDVFHSLAVVNNSVTNTGLPVSLQDLVSFPLDIYSEVGLLNHMVVLFLIF